MKKSNCHHVFIPLNRLPAKTVANKKSSIPFQEISARPLTKREQIALAIQERKREWNRLTARAYGIADREISRAEDFAKKPAKVKCRNCGVEYFPRTLVHPGFCSAQCSSAYAKAHKEEIAESRLEFNGSTECNRHKQKYSTIESLTPELRANVRQIMSLPHAERWNAGAKNWTEGQRQMARLIENSRFVENSLYALSL